jgi:hypothetical protein
MDDVSGPDSPARLNDKGERGTEVKNKGMIINTDAGNCQTFSWHFRASLALADKLCYFSYFGKCHLEYRGQNEFAYSRIMG